MEGRWREASAVRVAAACLACALATSGCESSESDAPPVTAVIADRPAFAFAPLIRLHPDEEHFPIAADRFLERATLKWRDGACYRLDDIATGRLSDRKTAAPVPRLDGARLGGDEAPYRQRALDGACDRRAGRPYLATELTRPYDPGPRPRGLAQTEGFYLDILTDSYDGDPPFERRGSGKTLGAVDAYYESAHAKVAGRGGLRVTYWLLYARHAPRGADGESVAEHEGDWEVMQVLLRRNGPRRWLPVAVRLGRDGRRMRQVDWSELERSGSHPILYAANGSHLLQPGEERHRRRLRSAEDTTVTVYDETATCDDCPSWRTWTRLRPLRRQPWYGFGGGWGLGFRISETSGPLGPRPVD